MNPLGPPALEQKALPLNCPDGWETEKMFGFYNKVRQLFYQNILQFASHKPGHIFQLFELDSRYLAEKLGGYSQKF